jgi:hypothetical protein
MGVTTSLPTNVRWSVAGLEIVAKACVVSAAIEAKAANAANAGMLRANAVIWNSFELAIGRGDRGRGERGCGWLGKESLTRA